MVGMNGRPTIVQMQALAAESRTTRRPAGGTVDYARDYQQQLLRMIRRPLRGNRLGPRRSPPTGRCREAIPFWTRCATVA